MTDKTKRKIEAMMPNDVRGCGCPECYTKGADPWAEWCERFEEIQALVDKQAEDEGLWFIAETAPEGYLQEHLRQLHALIEREVSAYRKWLEDVDG